MDVFSSGLTASSFSLIRERGRKQGKNVKLKNEEMNGYRQMRKYAGMKRSNQREKMGNPERKWEQRERERIGCQFWGHWTRWMNDGG